MWLAIALSLLIWFVLKFVLQKGGYSHILLVLGLSLLVVQIIAYRKTRYHKTASESDNSI